MMWLNILLYSLRMIYLFATFFRIIYFPLTLSGKLFMSDYLFTDKT